MLGATMKGRISSVDQDKHICRVVTEDGFVTHDLVIPFYLRRESGELKKDMEVIFSVFPDNTGILLHRMDGDWEYTTIKSMKILGDLHVEKNENTEEEPDTKLGKIFAKSDVHTEANLKAGAEFLDDSGTDNAKYGMVLAASGLHTIADVKAKGDMIAKGDFKASDGSWDDKVPEDQTYTAGVTLRTHKHQYTTPVYPSAPGDTGAAKN